METTDQNAIHSLDARARMIRDPVLRLAYLRRMTAGGLPQAAPVKASRRRLKLAALVAAVLALPAGYRTEVFLNSEAISEPSTVEAAEERWPNVWMVEENAESELYSNGLRIEKAMTVDSRPRRKIMFPSSGGAEPQILEWSDPAGIVFHTTESRMHDFEQAETPRLKLAGKYLLEYVRAERAYHYVVDRFGRVHRIVEEGGAANHAGWSVWADADWIYVNLNESFLAVAFEAQSRPSNGEEVLTPAQIQAGRVLTEMLRSRYHIPAGNCVTHAQVSINPRNGRVGYHTDWADDFPFRALGLPDNYERPLVGIAQFGFELDAPLAGSRLARGQRAAEAALRRKALELHVPSAQYRAGLRRRWFEIWNRLNEIRNNEEKAS